MTASRTPWWSGRGGNQRSDFSCHVHAKNRGFVERVWSEALGVMNHSITGSFINSTLPTMPTRKATATWSGDLPNGSGNMAFGSGAFEGAFSFRSRFEDGTGTNPEELIGAAHAGCFSMAFSNVLSEAGFTPERVDTTAHVTLEMTDDGGPTITKIALDTEAEVPGIDNDTFQQHAAAAKEGCPVSKALAGTDITLNAKLASGASA